MAGPLHAVENYAFMTLVLQVDIGKEIWRKVVPVLLSEIHGVRTFKMSQDGKLVVSGIVYPKQLLKMLASKAGKILALREWQFGECHSNLYLTEPEPEKPQQTNFNGYDAYDGGYHGCNPYYANDMHLYSNGGYGVYPHQQFPSLAWEAPPEKPQQTNFNGYNAYDGGYNGCNPYYANDMHLYNNGGYGVYPQQKFSSLPLEAPPDLSNRKGTVSDGDEPSTEQKLQAAKNPRKIAKVAQKQCCSVM